jgi:hypothetical protein
MRVNLLGLSGPQRRLHVRLRRWVAVELPRVIVVDRFEVGRGLPEDPEDRVYVDPAQVRLKLAKKLSAALEAKDLTVPDLCRLVNSYSRLVGAHVPVAIPGRRDDVPTGPEPYPAWMLEQPDDPKPDAH